MLWLLGLYLYNKYCIYNVLEGSYVTLGTGSYKKKLFPPFCTIVYNRFYNRLEVLPQQYTGTYSG